MTAEDRVAELEHRAFSALTPEEQQALSELLGRLLTGLPEIGAAP